MRLIANICLHVVRILRDPRLALLAAILALVFTALSYAIPVVGLYAATTTAAVAVALCAASLVPSIALAISRFRLPIGVRDAAVLAEGIVPVMASGIVLLLVMRSWVPLLLGMSRWGTVSFGEGGFAALGTSWFFVMDGAFGTALLYLALRRVGTARSSALLLSAAWLVLPARLAVEVHILFPSLFLPLLSSLATLSGHPRIRSSVMSAVALFAAFCSPIAGALIVLTLVASWRSGWGVRTRWPLGAGAATGIAVAIIAHAVGLRYDETTDLLANYTSSARVNLSLGGGDGVLPWEFILPSPIVAAYGELGRAALRAYEHWSDPFVNGASLGLALTVMAGACALEAACRKKGPRTMPVLPMFVIGVFLALPSHIAGIGLPTPAEILGAFGWHPRFADVALVFALALIFLVARRITERSTSSVVWRAAIPLASGLLVIEAVSSPALTYAPASTPLLHAFEQVALDRGSCVAVAPIAADDLWMQKFTRGIALEAHAPSPCYSAVPVSSASLTIIDREAARGYPVAPTVSAVVLPAGATIRDVDVTLSSDVDVLYDNEDIAVVRRRSR